MLHLIRLEIQKNSFRGYILGFILTAIAIGLLNLGMLEVVTNDGSRIPVISFYEIIASFFMIVEGTMIAGIIIDEYEKNTISLMYQYPIARIKIFVAKLLLIYGMTAFSMLLANLCLHGVMYGITKYIDHYMQFRSSMGNFWHYLQQYIVISLYYPIIGFIPLVVGMKRKTALSTIVTSVILVSVLGGNFGKNNNMILFTLLGAILALIGLVVTFYTLRKVNTEDLL